MSAAPPRTATSLPQNGGNDVIRAATRRRHAASQLLMLHPPAGQIGNQRRAYSPRLVPNCGAGGRGQDLAGLQNDADHPPAHQAPPFVEGTARPAEPGRGAGGRRGLDGMCTAMKSPTGVEGDARAAGQERPDCGAWRRGLDGMCTAMKSPTGVEGTGGSGGLGQASRSTTPSRRFTHGGNREARVARGAGPRCRWAAAGLGRASRSTTPSRRLAHRGHREAEPGRGAGGRRQGLAGLRDRRLRAEGSRVAISRAGRRPPAHTAPQQPAPQRHEAATGFPATASSRSISATQQSGTASDQAVMSTWSSTAARPASRRATGTRNGEQDT